MLDINTDAASQVTNAAYAVPPAAPPPSEDLYVSNLKKDFGAQPNPSGMMKNQVLPERQSGQVSDSRYRSTEEVYQLERAKQVKSFEDQQKKAEADALSMRSSVEVSKSSRTDSSNTGLRPSLANNPFYFSETVKLIFAEMRPLIASRMVQLLYTRLEA